MGIRAKNNINKALYLTFIILSLLLITFIFLNNIFNINIINNSGVYTSHFNAVFYSVSEVFNGKALGVNFFNQYGLYPYFLLPIFKLIGLSTYKFTIIMSSILSISFIFIFLFINKVVKNNVAKILGFTTVVYFEYLLTYGKSYNQYFQYLPIRLIFPSILIFLVAVYFKGYNKIIYYLLFILNSIAILWNIDSGIIVFLTWILVLCFSELFKTNKKKIFIKILKHILISVLIFSSIFIIYSSYIYFRFKSFPDVFSTFQYQKYFYYYGFYMLPMKGIQFWNIVILIYVIALQYSIYCVINKKDSYLSKITFMLAILGVGIFSYYQGRSHDVVLTLVWYPALILVVLFLDNLLNEFGKYNFKSYIKLLQIISILFLMISNLFTVGGESKTMYNNINTRLKIINRSTSESLRNVDFIKNNTKIGEKVVIISYNSGVYYAESNTKSVTELYISGFSEIFLKNDYIKLEKFLKNNKNVKIFYDVNFSKNNGEIKKEIINEFYGVLFTYYKPLSISSDKTIELLKKK